MTDQKLDDATEERIRKADELADHYRRATQERAEQNEGLLRNLRNEIAFADRLAEALLMADISNHADIEHHTPTPMEGCLVCAVLSEHEERRR